MDSPLKTRSQRRMEKRQAVTLLVLILGVALGSFALGVMVGNRGSDRVSNVATEEIETPEVSVTENTTQPVTEPAPTAEPTPEESLSFYERLPKGEAPLGSGINLPPEDPPKQTVETVVEEQLASGTQQAPTASAKVEPVPAPTAPPVVEKPAEPAAAEPAKVAALPKPAPAETPSAKPLPASTKGGYAVQVASLKTREAALGFQKKLEAKGYPAFTVEAEVKKQQYFRVMVGPYDKSGAYEVDKQLRAKEKIKGFVKRI